MSLSNHKKAIELMEEKIAKLNDEKNACDSVVNLHTKLIKNSQSGAYVLDGEIKCLEKAILDLKALDSENC